MHRTASNPGFVLRRFVVRSLLLGAATALPGCIGIGYTTTEERVGMPPSDRGALSTADLTQQGGEPDERASAADGTELWIYRRSLRWAAVYLCVGLCVPLGVPVGRTSDTFHVRDGVVESVDSVRSVEIAHLCGFIPGMCPTFGCESRRF